MTKIIDRVWAACELHPQSIAIVYEKQALTYAELIERSEWLAQHIVSITQPDEPVGLMMNRSPDAIVGIMAIMKAGLSYVPLDPSHPISRRSTIAKNLNLRTIITEAGGGLDLNELGVGAHYNENISGYGLALSHADTEYVPSQFKDLAYILHTSGTTGQPKGVAMPEKAVAPLISWQIQTSREFHHNVPITSQFAPLNFDVSFQEIFSTLGDGGCLVIVPEETRLDPRQFLELLARENISRTFLPPAVLHRLAEAAITSDVLPTLQEIIVAGEQLRLTPDTINFFSKLPECKLVNQYGPTETHVVTVNELIGFPNQWPSLPSIGRQLPWVKIRILGSDLNPVAEGDVGEIYIGGLGVASGYIGQQSLTSERFISIDGERYYRTGDLARQSDNQEIEYLGRADRQVKIRGVRVELGEVEVILENFPNVHANVVDAVQDPTGTNRLVAAIVVKAPIKYPDDFKNQIRRHLKSKLPEHYVPSIIAIVDKIPLLPNGKTDRQALQKLISSASANNDVTYGSTTEKMIAQIWQDVIGSQNYDRKANFFDVGGHSIALPLVQAQIKKQLNIHVSIVSLLEKTTIEDLALLVSGSVTKLPKSEQRSRSIKSGDIAIIGMSCRFPDADTPEEFWKNLESGADSIIKHSTDMNGNVRASAPLKGVDLFDANLFGISDKDATIMDPQHRIFLECAWEAFEDAGYDPKRLNARVGVYAGSGINSYLINNVHPNVGYRPNRSFIETMEDLTVMIGGDRDYLPSRVSYKLGLTGPAINIQSACSTSLVSVHLACQSLHTGDCDLALAGSAAVMVPQNAGHVYEPGMVFSADGRCSPFDASAQGTIFGSGAGIVLLKRLEDAIADGDAIHAVIKGSAINNDGSNKIGYTAPSVSGQEKVIADAIRIAGIEPQSISYIESHGTATALGDAIEIEALKRALGENSDVPCYIGSVKSNIGHLGWAAGMAGLIKTVEALKHKRIPATLNFKTPNPELNLNSSRFKIAADTLDWESFDTPLRAGVSAFGIGGTNAHIILEEVQRTQNSDIIPSRKANIIALSAATAPAASALAQRIAGHLREHNDSLENVAFTINTGRQQLPYRLVATGETREDLIDALTRNTTGHSRATSQPKQVTFLYTGYGSHYENMGRELFETQPVFQATIEKCDEILRSHNGKSIIDALYHDYPNSSFMSDIEIGQPILFSFQAALTEMWKSFGVVPSVVIGHSLGEFAAAWQAGVFSLEDGVRITAERGRLLSSLTDVTSSRGVTMSVMASAERILELSSTVAEAFEIAAENSPTSTVVSGSIESIGALSIILEDHGIKNKYLNIPVAAHSKAMVPLIPELEKFIGSIQLSSPSTRIISNLTGDFVGAEIATSKYWGRHLREKVRFRQGVSVLSGKNIGAFLEIGPKPALLALAEESLPNMDTAWASSLKPGGDWKQIAEALGILYSAGHDINWKGYENGFAPSRIHLPTYPFQKESYWIGPADDTEIKAQALPEKVVTVVEWSEAPSPRMESISDKWLLVAEDKGLATKVKDEIQRRGGQYIVVENADVSSTTMFKPDMYQASLTNRDQLSQIVSNIGPIQGIVYLPDPDEPNNSGLSTKEILEQIYSKCQTLVNLSALASARREKTGHISIITSNSLLGHEGSSDMGALANASLSGLARNIALENPELKCRHIDYASTTGLPPIESLLDELLSVEKEDRISFANGKRFVGRVIKKDTSAHVPLPFPEDGTCLITGGLGGLGMMTAEWVASHGIKRIVLVGRSAPTEDALGQIQELKDNGSEIIVYGGDISSAQVVSELFDIADLPESPLRWIIHSAGSLADGPSLELNRDKLMTTLVPKVAGAWNLHTEASKRGCLIERFDMYSSVVGTYGNPGQANHAAANSFLDALAVLRTSIGLPGKSIAWGAWANVGVLGKDSLLLSKVEAHGFRLIPGAQGHKVLDYAYSTEGAHIIYAPMDWQTFLTANNLQKVPFFSRFAPATSNSDRLLKLVAVSSEEQKYEVITGYLQRLAAKALGMPIERLLEQPVDRPFSDFKLDSLSAIQIRNSLQEEIGVRLPPSLLFQYGNIQDLTKKIEEEIRNRPAEAIAEDSPPQIIEACAESLCRPISEQQRRWLRLLEINYGRLLIPIVFEAPLKNGAFREALTNVVERHEVLRWSFPSEDAFVLTIDQVIPQDSVLFTDLSSLSFEEKKTILASEATAARQSMPDPSTSVPWAIKCFAIAPDQFVALLSVQHLEFDGTSVSLLVNELRHNYGAALEGRKDPLPPVAISYNDYVKWQQKYKQEAIVNDRSFFQGFYSGIEGPTVLPAHDGFAQTTSNISGCHSVDPQQGIMSELRNISAKIEVSPFAVMATAYARLLSEVSGNPDVVIGTIVAGRPIERFQEIIGPFVAPFPIPVSVAGRDTMTIARRWNEAIASVNDRCAYPVADLTKHVKAFQGMPIETYFTDAFIMYNNYPREDSFLKPKVEVLECLAPVTYPLFSAFDNRILPEIAGLFLIIDIWDEEPRFNFWYHKNRFSSSTIEAWAERYQAILDDELKEIRILPPKRNKNADALIFRDRNIADDLSLT